MNFKDLVSRTRTFRRFDQSHAIGYETLESLVDLARLSSSGANKQPLKFMIFNAADDCDRIFPSLAWAGYLKDWAGPDKGERPSAYVVILGDRNVTDIFGVDHGIAGHSILLGATESGLGGCMIASLMREELKEELKIPDNFDILLVIALGKPVENVIIDDIIDDDVKYWRDDNKNHHVPKRLLKDIIVKF